MAKITREAMSESFIDNAEMKKMYVEGVHTGYEIKPCDGYVLHDARLDSELVDGERKIGFREGATTVRRDYNFYSVKDNVDGKPIEKIGDYAFFVVRKESIKKILAEEIG